MPEIHNKGHGFYQLYTKSYYKYIFRSNYRKTEFNWDKNIAFLKTIIYNGGSIENVNFENDEKVEPEPNPEPPQLKRVFALMQPLPSVSPIQPLPSRSPRPQTRQVVAPQINLLSADDNFWRLISKTVCLNRDEGHMTKKNIKLTPNEQSYVLDMINRKYLPELTAALNDISTSLEDNELEYKNFLTHIIFKGREFYDMALQIHDIVLYMNEIYYPIYTWLSN